MHAVAQLVIVKLLSLVPMSFSYGKNTKAIENFFEAGFWNIFKGTKRTWYKDKVQGNNMIVFTGGVVYLLISFIFSANYIHWGTSQRNLGCLFHRRIR